MNHKTGTIFFGTICSTILMTASAQALTYGDAKRGEKAFNKASCVVCHPGGGNSMNPDSPLKGPKFAREFTDTKIESVVRKGIPKSSMPAFDKARVSDQELADIIAYIRTLTPKTK